MFSFIDWGEQLTDMSRMSLCITFDLSAMHHFCRRRSVFIVSTGNLTCTTLSTYSIQVQGIVRCDNAQVSQVNCTTAATASLTTTPSRSTCQSKLTSLKYTSIGWTLRRSVYRNPTLRSVYIHIQQIHTYHSCRMPLMSWRLIINTAFSCFPSLIILKQLIVNN